MAKLSLEANAALAPPSKSMKTSWSFVELHYLQIQMGRVWSRGVAVAVAAAAASSHEPQPRSSLPMLLDGQARL
ncbi:hypothetical protein HYFRA_00001504 [Hymenoscyphus fraxineus]|uniref:Uncharacterized protein n=1 Tax=Hymenoscyphus fraxineus TaxID=746836 RepID=A0A9N9PZD4_9HELO|nr:hypothetical protein HYFRA_00001504 [Hymenoscyphus fraxineus]